MTKPIQSSSQATYPTHPSFTPDAISNIFQRVIQHYFEMGTICHQEGRKKESVHYFMPITKIDGFEESPEAPTICVKMGDNTENEEWYRRAIRIVESHHQNARGYYQKGIAHLRLNENQEAKNSLEMLVAMQEETPEPEYKEDLPEIKELIFQLSNQ